MMDALNCFIDKMLSTLVLEKNDKTYAAKRGLKRMLSHFIWQKYNNTVRAIKAKEMLDRISNCTSCHLAVLHYRDKATVNKYELEPTYLGAQKKSIVCDSCLRRYDAIFEIAYPSNLEHNIDSVLTDDIVKLKTKLIQSQKKLKKICCQ